jgi:putative spermidine/putrescine transport system substrate-binding protein
MAQCKRPDAIGWKLLGLIAILALLTLASACGGAKSAVSQSSSAAPADEISNPTANAVTAAPQSKPEFITIRVWGDNDIKALSTVAGAEFTKDTGVKIKFDTTDEAVSYAKLDQQMKSGARPDVDASLQAQQRAYLDGLRGFNVPISTALAPNMLDCVRSVTAPPGTAATASSWSYVNIYSVTVPFIIRSDLVDPATVQSWNDLFQPSLRKSVVLDQIYTSSAFELAATLGVQPTSDPSSMDSVWRKASEIKPNLAALAGNTDVTQALVNGTAKVAVSFGGAGVSAANAGAKIAFVAPKDGLYVVADSYYIHKGIPDENAYYAQVFANYLVSAASQSKLAAVEGVGPINPAATVPAFMKDNPNVFPVTEAQFTAAHAIVAPIPIMAKNDAAWQEAWENAIN